MVTSLPPAEWVPLFLPSLLCLAVREILPALVRTGLRIVQNFPGVPRFLSNKSQSPLRDPQSLMRPDSVIPFLLQSKGSLLVLNEPGVLFTLWVFGAPSAGTCLPFLDRASSWGPSLPLLGEVSA